MRLFFFMLILLNGAFLAVNAFREPRIINQPSTISQDIPPLALLNEKIKAPNVENTVSQEPPTVSDEKQEPSLDLKTWLAKFTAENASNNETEPKKLADQVQQQTSCYTAGPFQTSDSLQQATRYFSSLNIPSQQRSIEENHYIGMLVYLPSLASRKEAVLVAKKLAAKGVKDYMLLNEPGKQHSLSLGVYGLKKNAEQRIKTLAKLNYQAESEARYRLKTVYWLDYAYTASNNQSDSSSEHMSSLKVSQIERNCKS